MRTSALGITIERTSQFRGVEWAASLAPSPSQIPPVTPTDALAHSVTAEYIRDHVEWSVELGRDALCRERSVLFGRTHAVPRWAHRSALARELQLDGTQRLLDIGCGPGSLTLLLAPHVATALGIDADPEMIEEAERATRRSGQANVSWRHMRAEELPGDIGQFELVTFAQSFHWMNRPAVAASVREMLTPDGACAYVHATTHRGDESVDPLAHPRPPYEEIGELVSEYLGPVRRAGRGSLPEGTSAGEEVILREAGFDGPHRIEVPTGAVVTRTTEEIVAASFSLSSSTPELFGSRRASFQRDLIELLHRTSPAGVFAERRREIALDIWRPCP